jgi:hypothetical protein
MPGTLEWSRSGNAKNGAGEAARRRQSHLAEATRYCLVGEAEAGIQAEEAQGGSVLATTGGTAVGSDVQLLCAYQEQKSTVESGLRWIKHPAAITPMGWEKPERIAALAMLTVVG